MEKADILEMTVKHLQSVQRQQLNMALQTDPTVIHKFKTGFMECADEVNRYVRQLDGVEDSVRQRLNSHLNNCSSSLEQIGSMTNFSNGYRSGASNNVFGNATNLPLAVSNNGSLFPALAQDLNNNPATGIQMGGVQLIPSRLPSGEFALIVPNTGNNNNKTNPAALINNNSNPAYPPWPANTSVTNNSTPVNDFAANFKRLSAFSKPQNNLINPLKVPAVSSYHQTTLTHTTYQHPAQQQQQHQQAFHTTTTTSPPLSPISSVSSHNEDSIMHTSSDFTNSRSVSPRQDKHNSFSGVFASPPSSAESSFVLSAAHLQQQQVTSTSNSDLNTSSSSSIKRSFSETADSSICSEDEPSSKKHQKDRQDNEDQDSMWRPW